MRVKKINNLIIKVHTLSFSLGSSFTNISHTNSASPSSVMGYPIYLQQFHDQRNFQIGYFHKCLFVFLANQSGSHFINMICIHLKSTEARLIRRVHVACPKPFTKWIFYYNYFDFLSKIYTLKIWFAQMAAKAPERLVDYAVVFSNRLQLACIPCASSRWNNMHEDNPIGRFLVLRIS